MIAKTRITVLADNTVVARTARGEHGLAFWIETDESRLLFDTGQGLVLADNARAMGVDLCAVRTVALSHGHYDHTGGLAALLREAVGPVTVHAHPDALQDRYHCGPAGAREIGMPRQSREALQSRPCRLVLERGPMEIAPGVWLTGEIPRAHTEEASTEAFCLDADGRRPDPFTDDQALYIPTEWGTVVLLGCAHAGMLNTLDHIRSLTGGRPICAIAGGMHLHAARAERVAWTAGELWRFAPGLLAPVHCTGQKAAAALCIAFSGACQAWGAGTRIELPSDDRSHDSKGRNSHGG